jgi:hypothetical protein
MKLTRAHWRELGYGAIGTVIHPVLGILLFAIAGVRILLGVDESEER